MLYKIAVCDDEWNYVGTLTVEGEVFTTLDLQEAQYVIEELEDQEDEYQYHIISEELH